MRSSPKLSEYVNFSVFTGDVNKDLIFHLFHLRSPVLGVPCLVPVYIPTLMHVHAANYSAGFQKSDSFLFDSASCSLYALLYFHFFLLEFVFLEIKSSNNNE